MASSTIQDKVLALHGAAFTDMRNTFSRSTGDPAIMPPVSQEISPEVEALIQRAFTIAHEALATDPKTLEDFEMLCERYKQKIEALVADALLLPAIQWNEFDSRATIAILDAAVEQLESLPSFDEIVQSQNLAEKVTGARDTTLKLVKYISLILDIGSGTKSRAGSLSLIGDNLEHDALGHLCYLRECLGFEARAASSSNTQNMSALRHALDVEAPFLKQVVAGTKAIATNTYEIASCDAATIATTAAAPNACRFRYRLSLNDSPIYSESEHDKDIRVRVEPGVPMFVDPNAFGLVLYNLVKNPIKLANFSHKPLPSVEIEIGLSSDRQCTSIFVRDDGIGVSYDTLCEYFTERARGRIAVGEPLQLAEECLLDEAWSQHVPPVALNSMILDRGASVGGGTGIGLAIANQIITNGLQGYIQLYNHPTRGAGVQILLPNVGSEVSAQDRWQITLGSLRHQLATGLPTA